MHERGTRAVAGIDSAQAAAHLEQAEAALHVFAPLRVRDSVLAPHAVQRRIPAAAAYLLDSAVSLRMCSLRNNFI